MPVVPAAELPPTHAPLIEKQPEARLMPPVVEKVEVAREKLMPPVLPMEKSEPGVDDAMPTKPFASMWKTVVVALAVEEETVKRGDVAAAAPATESLPHGVVVPMPRLPANVEFPVPT